MADGRWQMGAAGILAAALALGGCAAGQAFRQGNDASRAGDLDEAVAAYRKAAQAAPDNPNYKIALQRAQLAASRAHLDKARDFESKDQLEAALGEYRQASEYDPTNRQATAKVAELDRTIRERIEASRPRPAIEQLRDRARAASAPPMLNPASRDPIRVVFTSASLRDILNAIAGMTGINVTYDRDVQDRATTVNLDGLTLEQALNQLMTMNQLSYKVVSDRSIFVFPDTTVKHAQYDEQVIRTFYLSHADATEVSQILSSVVRLPGIAVQPIMVANKTANTLTVRGTASMVQILEKIIQQNDKPRAEIVVDVEILEVDRTRAKTYGLNLSEYALGGVFSPEVSPSATTTPSTGTGTGTGTPTPTTAATGTSTPPSGVKSPPPFNLNTISRGVSTADFYLAVPTAIVRFLESDTRNKVIAKPQLRGAEGAKLSLKLGDQIPIISTSYTPIATGGAGVNPLSSYQYKDVGVTVDMTPTVTLEGDVRLDLTVISSTRKADVVIAGVNIPSFGNREVTTRLRLRDGESNLLAGLLQENERKVLTGFPGAIHVPVLSQLFSSNDQQIDQTDIVMLLTPHVIRTHEITEEDLKPIYIGSQQNLGLNGPPPLIAAPPIEPIQPAAAQAPGTNVPAVPAATPTTAVPSQPNPQRAPGPGGTGPTVAPPPGSSPVPGTVVIQPPPGQPPAGQPAPAPSPDTPPVAPPITPEPPAPAAPVAAPGQPPPQGQPPQAQPSPGAAASPPAVPTTSSGIGSAQVLISAPSTPFRVGGGPYTVPLAITDASRLSTVTLTLIFDPARLRVRTVQEGSFMRAGGATVTFSQQVNNNRIDITLVRSADATGASGTGLLAAILFDAIAPGSATLSLSGSATGPGGTPMGLRFTPVTITVQQ
ncbi:MAG TPA: secretin N-terminal domain-containing protein [Vicinamibacterales bacterium]|nr:secretin N-terminal domain-containing protein [Vicinamibacterales bacterium]